MNKEINIFPWFIFLSAFAFIRFIKLLFQNQIIIFVAAVILFFTMLLYFCLYKYYENDSSKK